MRTSKRLLSHRPLPVTLSLVSVLLTSLAAMPASAQTTDTPSTPAPTTGTPGGTSPAPGGSSPATPAPAPPGTTPAPEPTQHRHARIGIGSDLGFFVPTSSRARNRFGNSWFSFGLGIGNVRKASAKGRFAFELSTLYKSKSDHHAFIAPVGVEYRRALGGGGDTIPYVGLSGDLVIADLRSPEDNVHSGFRTSGGGSVFLGTTFSERGYVEARYLFISKIKGFDLSGLNLTAGIRF